MRLKRLLQRIGLGIIAAVLCLSLGQGVVFGQEGEESHGVEESIENTEEEEEKLNEDIFNSFGIGGAASDALDEQEKNLKAADQETYQCYKYEKICPDSKPSGVFPRPDLRLECAVCKGYLEGDKLTEYKKYFYYDFDSNFEFNSGGTNSESNLVERAKAKEDGGDRDGDGIPDDFDNCPDRNNPDQAPGDCNTEESKYFVYIEQRGNTGDRPNSSEYFDVTNFDSDNPANSTGLLAPGQRNFFNGASGNPVLDFIVRVVELLVSMIGLATLVVVVVGAYLLLTAAGDEEQLSKGKDVIKLGLLGMVIAIFAYSIVTFVQALIY